MSVFLDLRNFLLSPPPFSPAAPRICFFPPDICETVIFAATFQCEFFPLFLLNFSSFFFFFWRHPNDCPKNSFTKTTGISKSRLPFPLSFPYPSASLFFLLPLLRASATHIPFFFFIIISFLVYSGERP